VGGWLQGRSADSISYDTPTAELMAERLQVTLPLAVMAMALTMVLRWPGAVRRVAPQPAG
jgi:peptide/nickel transport system permease protein